MFDADFLSRFTSHLRDALQKALAFAIQNGRELVEPGDMLVGLMQEKGCIGGEIILKSGIRVEAAEDAFRGTPTFHQTGAPIAPDLSPAVKRLLEKCVLTAHVYEHKYVGTEHLLFALLESSLPSVHAFLEQHGLRIEPAREQLAGVLKSTAKFPDLASRLHESNQEENDEPNPATEPRMRNAREKKVNALEAFARDLTAPDSVADLDPVIGRDAEMDRVVQILCRRFKNNPILLGEPGVGKTAIVEGLAQRLAAGDVPDRLQGRRIFAVDLALMVAGTMYRGEFEARIKQLVDEARQDKNVILFIDELHTIVGAGSTSGSLDAANILKPALARGEIHCIGATTWSEYKKHIEPDAALERRYQPVDVREPSSEDTLKMLQGLRRRYEEYHGVRFEAAALETAVRYADRYLAERFFPDKAIDLMDEAAAYVNAKRRSSESIERLRSLDIAIAAARENKEDAVRAGSLPQAAEALEEEQRLEQEKINVERRRKQSRLADRQLVSPIHIAEVLARLAHIPLSSIVTSDREHLAGLEQRLKKLVVGQDMAIASVAESIRKARLGLSDPQRPKVSLLFVGPSGVGKTALARALAKEIFGHEDALIKIDMSEFSESHSLSKLLGSPAGYVGYRDSNRFADAIRKRPHAVLLFDEFEKAHPDVQHLLLQALEDGRISDAAGRTVPFHHAYVVLTSNVGAEAIRRRHIGFAAAGTGADHAFETFINDQLRERFRPELLNRLDRIVVFRPLETETLREILRRELSLIFTRLEQTQRVAYTAGDDVLDWLLKREINAEEGARAIRHLVEREVTQLLSRSLIDQPNRKKGKVKIAKGQLAIG